MYRLRRFYVYCCLSRNSCDGDDANVANVLYRTVTASVMPYDDERGVSCLDVMLTDDANVQFTCDVSDVLIFC